MKETVEQLSEILDLGEVGEKLIQLQAQITELNSKIGLLFPSSEIDFKNAANTEYISNVTTAKAIKVGNIIFYIFQFHVIKTIPNDALLFTIPEGYRPAEQIRCPLMDVAEGKRLMQMDINPNGNVNNYGITTIASWYGGNTVAYQNIS